MLLSAADIASVRAGLSAAAQRNQIHPMRALG
jgi:hypothetical protein